MVRDKHNIIISGRTQKALDLIKDLVPGDGPTINSTKKKFVILFTKRKKMKFSHKIQ